MQTRVSALTWLISTCSTREHVSRGHLLEKQEQRYVSFVPSLLKSESAPAGSFAAAAAVSSRAAVTLAAVCP